MKLNWQLNARVKPMKRGGNMTESHPPPVNLPYRNNNPEYELFEINAHRF